MAVPQRIVALGIGSLALALTIVGVVVAATDRSNGPTVDPLALHGYPPRSANVSVSASSGSGAALSAQVAIDFSHQRVDAVVHFPLIITTVAVELRDVANRLYLRSADAATGTWLTTSQHLPSLFGLSLELVNPATDFSFVTGYHRSVRHLGDQTTYNFWDRHATVTTLTGRSAGTSLLGSVSFSITVGARHEFNAATLHVTSGSLTTWLHVNVESYNHAGPIVRPAPANVKPLHSQVYDRLFKNQTLTSILVPLNLFTAGSSSLS